MEAQAPPLIMATLRFIQLGMPLPPLKPMVTLIEPSALRAAKALPVE
jgi:hypothetical protein